MECSRLGERVRAQAPEAIEDIRRENRFVAEKQIVLMPWGGAGEYKARQVYLLDCSAHGLGLRDVAPMEPGEQFAVYLRLDQVTMVLYTVRHSIPLPDGTYKIGAQLTGFIGNAQDDPDKVLTSLLQHGLV